MSELAELLPGPKEVELDGRKYAVNGLTLTTFATVLSRFPVLNAIFAGKGNEMNVTDILSAGDPAVGAIIAAGFGHFGDEEWESDAARLTANRQVKLLRPIVELTMPDGFGPFVEELAEVLRILFPTPTDQLREKVLQKAMRKQSQLSSNTGAATMKPSGNSRPDSSPPTAS
jgi:hypothetical protein